MIIKITDRIKRYTIPLGRKGEFNVTTHVFDLSDYARKYGDLAATLMFENPKGDYFPIGITQDATSVTWEVRSDVTEYAGNCKARLYWTDANHVKKSAEIICYVEDIEKDITFPEDKKDWYFDVNEKIVELRSKDLTHDAAISELMKYCNDVLDKEADITGKLQEIEDTKESALSEISGYVSTTQAAATSAVLANNSAKSYSENAAHSSNNAAEFERRARDYALRAETASGNASTSETNASRSATSASTSASRAATSASSASTSASKAETYAQQAISAKNTVTKEINTARTNALNDISEYKSASITRIENATTTAAETVETAGATAQNAIVEKTDEQLERIPDVAAMGNAVNGLKENLRQLAKTSPNLFDVSTEYKERLLAGTSKSVSTNALYNTSEFIDVEPNTVYTVSDARRICECGDLASGRPYRRTIDGTNGVPSTFTTGSDTYCVRFSYYATSKDVQFVKGNTLPKYTPYGVMVLSDTVLESASEHFSESLFKKINGKVGLSFGDSICYGAGNSGKGILDILGDKYGITVHDFAVGGASCMYFSDRSCIVEQITNTDLSAITPDFIIIDGLSNDVAKRTNAPSMDSWKGTFDDSFDFANKDYHLNFANGLENILGLLKTKYPSVPIIYFIPHSSSSRVFNLELEYGDLARQICKKWSIPVADIYKDGNLTCRVQAQADLYAPDGTHPNADGYEHAYMPIIEELLYRLM